MTGSGLSIIDSAILVAIGPNEGDGATYQEIAACSWTPTGDALKYTLARLQERGLISAGASRGWLLTDAGYQLLDDAEQVLDDA